MEPGPALGGRSPTARGPAAWLRPAHPSLLHARPGASPPCTTPRVDADPLELDPLPEPEAPVASVPAAAPAPPASAPAPAKPGLVVDTDFFTEEDLQLGEPEPRP